MDYRIGSKSGKWLTVFAASLAISIAGSLLVDAQIQATAPAQSAAPAFEVVSVKVNKPGQSRELSIQYLAGGRFSARAVPIPLLILEGYDLTRLEPSEEFRKLDVSVIERDLYDIDAIAPKDAIPPGSSAKVRNDSIKAMLQTLLRDRFKLRIHHETREMPIYAIVVGKNGPKFSTGLNEQCADRPTNYFDPASCHSVADLVRLGTRVGRFDRPLVDKTGLTELYSIPSVDWSAIIPGALKSNPGIEPSQLFSDILDKLGLKIETQKANVDMVLIDHVEPPSLEN